MWDKIYLLVLALSVLAMGVLAYFCFDSLQSITKPADVAANYNFYSNAYSTLLWISSIVLLILANVLLWTERKAWALWTTFLFFAAFVLLQNWWLGGLYSDFIKQNNVPAGALPGGVFAGAVLCVVAAVGIFFDQFLITRLHGKMQNKVENQPEEILPVQEEKPAIDPSATE